MKKIIVFVMLMAGMVSFTANAQHMSFKGISLGENATSFVSQLKEKGFTFENKVTDYPICDVYKFKGFFAIHTCDIWVFSTKDGQHIFKVTVWFPEETTWFDIKSDYMSLLSSFTKKYGSPSSNYEFFASPYYEGDGYEMSAISLEKCHYAAFWSVGKNTIMLWITKYGQIEIVYEDTENLNVFKSIKSDSVQDDI